MSVTINGHAAATAKISVPREGPWFADCELLDDAAGLETGAATLKVGDVSLKGTIVADHTGTFGLRKVVRIIAGAAGWRESIAAQSYHNDAGVTAQLVAEDVARSVGETLGSFTGGVASLGIDYSREAGVASRVIEDAARGAPWWLDFDGVTHVGAPAAIAIPAADYDLIHFDPQHRIATLAVDVIDAIPIGGTLSEGLDLPVTVRALEITISARAIRVKAWCGDNGRQTLTADLLRGIVARMTDSKLHGVYRYRVLRMNADRVDVQAISSGVPDLLAISMRPGAAGAHAKLPSGSHVLVQFVEGDRAQPVITGFAGKDGTGHVPDELILAGSTLRGARQGDLVQCGGVGTIVTLYPVTGSPAPPNAAVVAGVAHYISFDGVPPTPALAAPLYGAISTGSSKVKL